MTRDGSKSTYRLTPFLLFAKKTKPKILEANPGLDLVSINNKLRELWLTMPGSEKVTWKRKLNRLVMESQPNQPQRMTRLVMASDQMTNTSGLYKVTGKALCKKVNLVTRYLLYWFLKVIKTRPQN